MKYFEIPPVLPAGWVKTRSDRAIFYSFYRSTRRRTIKGPLAVSLLNEASSPYCKELLYNAIDISQMHVVVLLNAFQSNNGPNSACYSLTETAKSNSPMTNAESARYGTVLAFKEGGKERIL